MTMINDKEWLNGLKAGDAVLVSTGSFYGPSVAKVDKVTATQIVVGSNRYRRDTGWLIGGGTWNTASLARPTPEALAEIDDGRRRRAALKRIHAATWRELPTETLEAVAALLPE